MGIIEIASFAITIFIGFIAVLRAVKATFENLTSLVINALLGGSLFMILNILGVKLALNFVTGGIIAFLGVPRRRTYNTSKDFVRNILNKKSSKNIVATFFILFKKL